MNNFNKMLEKTKKWLLDDSKSYVIKKTYLERPRLYLAGFLYIVSIFAILFVGIEYLDFGKILAPLDLFEPITKFFIDVETHEPRNILGWVYLILVFLGVIMAFFGLCIPGFYMVIKGEVLTDKEWPDDPEKTKKWRDKNVHK